jgi:N-acetylneuraminate synthase
MPEELERLCEETRDAWLSMGAAGYERKRAEEGNVKFRRSVYFVKDLNAGDVITPDSVRRIRPGFGLPPKYEQELIGRRVTQDVTIGTATSWNLIDQR